jgi:hypothetical protein
MIIDGWYELADKLNYVTLNDNNDKVQWKWTANKQFTVKSVHEHLTRDDNGHVYKWIWK